VAAC